MVKLNYDLFYKEHHHKLIMRLFFLGTLIFLSLGLTGCDQIRQKIADTLAPPSALEMAARMNELTDQQKPQEAIEQGKNFLKNNKDSGGFVNNAMTKAYLAAGEPGSAIESIKATSATVESKTDGANPIKPDSQSSVELQQTRKVSVDGASVTTGPNGTVVRAGDAVVIMPK